MLIDEFDQLLEKTQNFWRYAKLFTPYISPEFRITLNEGNTPLVSLQKIAPTLGLSSLLAKEEFRNPGHSHKARAMAYQLSLARREGKKKAAISSTGNAAIAAALYAPLADVSLTVFVMPDTATSKLQYLQSLDCTVTITEKPLQSLRAFCATHEAENLNASQSTASITAYTSIAYEIAETNSIPDDVVVFSSSGSTYLGIVEGFQTLIQLGKISSFPKVHCIYLPETQIPGVFHSQVYPHALVKRPTLQQRVTKIEEALQESKGTALAVTDYEILASQSFLNTHNIAVSPESCGVFAGLQNLCREQKLGTTIILFTGSGDQWAT